MFESNLQFVGIEGELSERLTRVGRLVLWAVVLTASIKPAEIFGPGEQSWVETPTSDLLFRCAILIGCAFASAVAVITGKVKSSSLIFVPFLFWTFYVAVARQSDLASAKQIGSYASWILFYVAACALLSKEHDYRLLSLLVIISVMVSAIGGELQHLIGFGPALGSMWPQDGGQEFKRTHTGGGGILLDTFTPYCAAFLLLSTAGLSWKRHGIAWMLVIWGTANILRGGLVAFGIALGWLVWRSARPTRRYMVSFMLAALLLGAALFGGTLAEKISGDDGEINTSGRLDEWPELLQWIQEEPLIGHGPDADMELLAKSPTGRDLRASHNELLSTGINYGLIGVLLLWMPLIILLGRSIRLSTRSKEGRREQLYGASAVLMMATLLGFTDNTLRLPGFMILSLAPVAVLNAGKEVFLVSSIPKRMVFASS